MQCDYKATLNRLISQLKNNQVSKKLRQMHGEWMHLTDIVGRYLYKAGVSANLVSIVGFAVGLLAINFLAMGMYLSALLCILINRAFDALDGAVARNREYSDFGVFLDATLDYTFYAGIIFGFALAYPAQNAVAASFLLFGLPPRLVQCWPMRLSLIVTITVKKWIWNNLRFIWAALPRGLKPSPLW